MSCPDQKHLSDDDAPYSLGKILEVLYATEDGFAVPADEEEEGMPPPPYDF